MGGLSSNPRLIIILFNLLEVEREAAKLQQVGRGTVPCLLLVNEPKKMVRAAH